MSGTRIKDLEDVFSHPPLDGQTLVFDAASKMFLPRQIVSGLCPLDYGAKGDGVRDDTVELALCFADADSKNLPVLLGRATYLTDTIAYRGQSIYGAGMRFSELKGKSGQDVLHVGPDATLGSQTRQFVQWQGFKIRVSDASDASASFPQRGGIGNAGYACDFPVGNGLIPMQTIDWDVQNVYILGNANVLGGQNKTCGWYAQYPPSFNSFKRIFIQRTAYGFWCDAPTSNLSSVQIGCDNNHFDSLIFEHCGRAMRLVNPENSKITNLCILAANSAACTHGLAINVVADQRAGSYQCSVDDAFIEGVVTAPWDIQGDGHYFNEITINGGNVTFGHDRCTYDNLSIDLSASTGTITGNYNKFRRTRRSNTPTGAGSFTDSGTGNVVEWAVQEMQRRGTGSPEGAVTAPIGATYHRLDGGAGTSFYVKESGAGNTGWVAK